MGRSCDARCTAAEGPGADAGPAAAVEPPGDDAEAPAGAPSAEVVVRAVGRGDRDGVVDLLARTFPSRVDRGRWNALFDYPWMDDPPDFGHLAEIRGEIVGFLGAVYSDRWIRGRWMRVCSLTSWCVREDRRALRVGALLAREFLADKVARGIPILVLTAGPHVRRFARRMGCRPFRSFLRVRYPIPDPLALLLPQAGPREVDPAALSGADVGEPALQVVRHHLGGGVRVRAFTDGERTCVVVTRRRTTTVARPAVLKGLGGGRSRPPGRVGRWLARLRDVVSGTLVCTELIHVSDPAFFVEHRRALVFAMVRQDRTVALTGDPRWLGFDGEDPPETSESYMYVNVPEGLGPSDFDALFSELVLLRFS